MIPQDCEADLGFFTSDNERAIKRDFMANKEKNIKDKINSIRDEGYELLKKKIKAVKIGAKDFDKKERNVWLLQKFFYAYEYFEKILAGLRFTKIEKKVEEEIKEWKEIKVPENYEKEFADGEEPKEKLEVVHYCEPVDVPLYVNIPDWLFGGD